MSKAQTKLKELRNAEYMERVKKLAVLARGGDTEDSIGAFLDDSFPGAKIVSIEHRRPIEDAREGYAIILNCLIENELVALKGRGENKIEAYISALTGETFIADNQ